MLGILLGRWASSDWWLVVVAFVVRCWAACYNCLVLVASLHSVVGYFQLEFWHETKYSMKYEIYWTHTTRKHLVLFISTVECRKIWKKLPNTQKNPKFAKKNPKNAQIHSKISKNDQNLKKKTFEFLEKCSRILKNVLKSRRMFKNFEKCSNISKNVWKSRKMFENLENIEECSKIVKTVRKSQQIFENLLKYPNSLRNPTNHSKNPSKPSENPKLTVPSRHKNSRSRRLHRYQHIRLCLSTSLRRLRCWLMISYRCLMWMRCLSWQFHFLIITGLFGIMWTMDIMRWWSGYQFNRWFFLRNISWIALTII